MQQTQDQYLLGHDDHELARLEHQAAILAPATTTLLTLAGIRPGLRVLDLGCGPGDVALTVADLVGPTGSVVGVDRTPEAIESARARADKRGSDNITFTVADVHEFEDAEPFDAVVGRLVLLYVPDPAAVLRRYAAALRPGGVVLSMEYDLPAARSVPACPTPIAAAGWALETFHRAGLNPTLGPQLKAVFRAADLPDVTILGIQPYLSSSDGAAMLAGIVRTLLPIIEQMGVATAEEVDVATLQNRIAAEMYARDAVMLPPTLVGAWAQVR